MRCYGLCSFFHDDDDDDDDDDDATQLRAQSRAAATIDPLSLVSAWITKSNVGKVTLFISSNWVKVFR